MKKLLLNALFFLAIIGIVGLTCFVFCFIFSVLGWWFVGFLACFIAFVFGFMRGAKD